MAETRAYLLVAVAPTYEGPKFQTAVDRLMTNSDDSVKVVSGEMVTASEPSLAHIRAHHFQWVPDSRPVYALKICVRPTAATNLLRNRLAAYTRLFHVKGLTHQQRIADKIDCKREFSEE